MTSKLRRGLLVVLFPVCVLTTHAQESATAKKPDTASSSTVPSTNDAEYKIGPQDVMRIDVWKEPDISRVIPVRPDGKISVPLLNDVQASGLTAMQLSASLREGLSKYLNNPQVTVTVDGNQQPPRLHNRGSNACRSNSPLAEYDRSCRRFQVPVDLRNLLS